MATKPKTTAPFGDTIAAAYATEGAAIELGVGVHEGELVPEAAVRIPLRTMNRHGLIAGATGTGKTRTLQVIAEQLSAAGVAVFAADVKGDVSGIALPGSDDGPAKKRARELALDAWTPAGFPVEYLSLGGIGPGVPVSATVSDFGPRLEAESARELLAERLERATKEAPSPERRKKASTATKGGADTIGDFLRSTTGRTIQRELVRGLFGLLRKRV